MTRTLTAYMPLTTYPEVVSDDAIRTALGFAAELGCELHVSVFSVDIPRMASPADGMLIDVQGMVAAAEETSQIQSKRLQDLVAATAGDSVKVEIKVRRVIMGAALAEATAEARYFDLTLMPWSTSTTATQDLVHALVFDSGRPVLLVPVAARPAPLDHIAIAWDGSRVAARALGDALPLLAPGGRISVLTVTDEKPLSKTDLAGALAAVLQRRGYAATAIHVAVGGRKIADALQDAALAEGAALLAMGGFGHSRLRDFILGGATVGVLRNLTVPTLLSH